VALVRPVAAAEPDAAQDGDAVPRHVAIIMDGNRRWARHRGLVDAAGHKAGVEAIRPIVRRATERGVEVLSLYAFSRENWSRPDPEVRTLLELMGQAIHDETPELRRNGARVRVLGRLDELPPSTQTAIREAVAATASGTRLTLNVAFNYSGRSELADAARRCVEDGLGAGQIDEAALAERLYTTGLPEPDLVIRTGGDQRLSNFLIWQAAYAEFYFCDAFWPDFDATAFDTALADFATRSRRFGR
jgi:undecaprenyl diphosphate synthase